MPKAGDVVLFTAGPNTFMTVEKIDIDEDWENDSRVTCTWFSFTPKGVALNSDTFLMKDLEIISI